MSYHCEVTWLLLKYHHQVRAPVIMFQRLVKLPCCLGWNRGSRSKRWTPQRSRFWHSEAWGCFFLRRGFLRTLGGPWSSIISTHIRPIIIIITTAHVIYWTYTHKSNFLHHEKFARRHIVSKSHWKVSFCDIASVASYIYFQTKNIWIFAPKITTLECSYNFGHFWRENSNISKYIETFLGWFSNTVEIQIFPICGK